MKLSRLIKRATEALGKYGDLEIDALWVDGDAKFQIEDYEGVIDLDEMRNKLQLIVG